MFLGQEDFDRFRPMVFPGTDIFIGIQFHATIFAKRAMHDLQRYPYNICMFVEYRDMSV